MGNVGLLVEGVDLLAVAGHFDAGVFEFQFARQRPASDGEQNRVVRVGELLVVLVDPRRLQLAVLQLLDFRRLAP